MDWGAGRPLADFVATDDLREIVAPTGAMLIGRRTYEVGKRMEADEPGSAEVPFPEALRPHPRATGPAGPEVTFLAGVIGEAVATALDAAGGKTWSLGADVAGQCLGGGSSTRSRCM